MQVPEIYNSPTEFISYYMHTGGWMAHLCNNKSVDKPLIFFKKYMLEYCTRQDPISLINLWEKSKKLTDKNKNSYKHLSKMQDALFFYIIKISLLYYVLPITGALLSLGLLTYKYHQNPHLFQLWLEKLRKPLPFS